MADSALHKLINWIAAQRVDVPDILAILDQVVDGFRTLGSRTLDAPFLNGHVLDGFQLDSAAGLASLVVGNGTFFDADGLAIRYEGKTVDASAFGAGDEFTIWARWEWVDSDQLSRVFISSGDEVLLPHHTKRAASVYLVATDASGNPPPGAYDWSYLIGVEVPDPFVPGTDELWVKHNVAFEGWQYKDWRPEGSAIAGVSPLYNGLEKVREALVSWTRGLANDGASWHLPGTIRPVNSLDTDLATTEASLADLKFKTEETKISWIRVPTTNWAIPDSHLAENRLILSQVSNYLELVPGKVGDTLERKGYLHCHIQGGMTIRGIHAVVRMDNHPGSIQEIYVRLRHRTALAVPRTEWVTIAEASLISVDHPTGVKISDTIHASLPFPVPNAASEDTSLEFCIEVGIINESPGADPVTFVSAVIEVEYARISLGVD